MENIIKSTRLIPGNVDGTLNLDEKLFEWISKDEANYLKIPFDQVESIIIDKSSSTAIINTKQIGVKMIHFQEIEGLAELEAFLNSHSNFLKEESGIYIFKQQNLDSSSFDEIDEATLNLLDAFAKIPMLTRQVLSRMRNEPEYLHRPRGARNSSKIPLNPWIFDRELKLPNSRIHTIDSIVPKDLSRFPLSVQATMIYNSAGRVLDDRKEFWMSVLTCEIPCEREGDYKEEYSRIEKDLRRSGEDDEIIIKRLESILRGYCRVDPEIGYVQGMADLALPFAKLFDDCNVGLNCFASLMQRLRGNFSHDGIGTQLKRLRDLIHEASPLLSDYLKFNRDSDDLFFAYRWLLLVFRREFVENDRFWDVMLAAEASNVCKIQDYPVFVALAMILSQRKLFMATCARFEDLLLFFHGMSGKWNLDEIIKLADQLINYFQK